jgi:hypothetical protein
MTRAFELARLRLLAMGMGLAFAVTIAMAPGRPAQAQTGGCGHAPAGASVSDLYLQPLGVLSAATPAQDCDRDYMLIQWRNDDALVARPPPIPDEGLSVRTTGLGSAGGKDITCGGANDGKICKGAKVLGSKLKQWREQREKRRKSGSSNP